jgi:hypothetical protein
MTTRFRCALGVYAVLALLAAFTLDGKLRAAVWILLAGLTVNTLSLIRPAGSLFPTPAPL